LKIRGENPIFAATLKISRSRNRGPENFPVDAWVAKLVDALL
jgi:hypothetical protein